MWLGSRVATRFCYFPWNNPAFATTKKLLSWDQSNSRDKYPPLYFLPCCFPSSPSDSWAQPQLPPLVVDASRRTIVDILCICLHQVDFFFFFFSFFLIFILPVILPVGSPWPLLLCSRKKSLLLSVTHSFRAFFSRTSSGFSHIIVGPAEGGTGGSLPLAASSQVGVFILWVSVFVSDSRVLRVGSGPIGATAAAC